MSKRAFPPPTASPGFGALEGEVDGEVNLAGDDDLVAAAELAHELARQFLRHASRVHVGGVEEIDAGFDRRTNERP